MDQKRFRQTLRRAFWIPFAVALIMAAILILEVRFLINRTGWVEHTDQVIRVSQQIYRSRIDQETGLRAYVLTRDERFLEPYYGGRKHALTAESELRQLIVDNPEQIERYERSAQIAQAWLSWADQAIAGTKAGQDAGGVDFQLRGKELMDLYRQVQTEFIDREHQLRDERLARSQRTLKFVDASVVALAVAFALGFSILGRNQLKSLSESFSEALNVAVEQRDWFHTTFTSIGDAVIATDAGGLITLMNPVAENLTGWRLKEAQGKPLADVFRIVNQDTRQAVENPVDKVRRLKRVVGLANHTILISRSGQELAIDDSGAPIFDPDGAITGIVLVFRDVTEQRKAEEIVARSQQTFFDLVERAPFGIYIVDSDFRISHANAASQRGAYRNVRPVIGRDFAEAMRILWPPDVAGEIIRLFRRTLETGEPYYSPVFTNPRHDVEAVESYEWELHRIKLADGRHGVICYYFDSTKLRQAEQDAREAQERLSALINSAMNAVIAIDAEQKIVLFNPAAEFMFGCTAQEAIGSLLERFIPARFREVHRKHIQNFGQTEVTNRSMSRPGTLWGLRSNGEEFPIEATISQVEVGGHKLFTVILRDITERRQAEGKLAEQAGLLDLASDAIIVRDETGRITYWNKGAENLYGWTAQEAMGRITHDLFRTQFPQPLAEILERFSKQKQWEGELVHTCKNGQQLTVFSRWAHIAGDEKSAGSLMESNTDITRRKQLEAALRSNERLALAGRLSASIAHEINNPIDTVTNVLYLIRQRLDGQPELGQLITMAQNEAQRVVEITKNMLSLHRESRAASAVNLSELLEGVVALIEETIAKGRRKIELAPGFKGTVEAFRSELRQVFTNVIKNAVEATAENGEIRIYSDAVQESGRDGVLIRVVDNGAGIPDELQSKLFSPFVTTKEESGTGLGLWVSRSIIDKHGGSIRLKSNSHLKAPGTTVSIFLPLKVDSLNNAGTAGLPQIDTRSA